MIRRRGFTLLEVMISLAVLSMVVVALMGTQTSALRLAGRHRDATLAAEFAQEKLAEALAIPVDQLTQDGGVGEGAYDGFEWERTLHPWRNKRLTRVEITIRTPSGDEVVVQTLVTATRVGI